MVTSAAGLFWQRYLDIMMTIKEFTRGYTAKSDRLASLSLGGTLLVYGGALAAGVQVWGSIWVVPCLVILAFASVRLYVLQHDFGHGSLFVSKRANELCGYLTSVFSLTPFQVMKYNHNMHHAYLGNLDHRETTEVYTMTLAEWQRAPWHRRLWYRIYRNPVVMLSLGGIYAYFLAYRWPRNTRKIGVVGVLVHNAMVASFVWTVWSAFGAAGLWVLGLSAVLAGMIGVFLVYLQHNFEETYWDRKPDLDFQKATLEGSSSLDLGWWWDLGTGNIAYHDLHHFNPGIPSYHLRRCQRALPAELRAHEPIGWGEALASFRLKLWDEKAQRLVRFPLNPQQAVLPAE